MWWSKSSLMTKNCSWFFHSLLDGKVEHITVGVQSALEGAAMAESKCTALGAELVKVFRMLTSCRPSSPLHHHNIEHSLPTKYGRRGRSHSPPARACEHHSDSNSQSPVSRNDGATSSPKVINQGQVSMLRPSPRNLSPNRVGRLVSKRGIRAPGRGAVFAKGTPSSQLRKGEGGYSGASEEGGSPKKERRCYLRNSPRGIGREKFGNDYKPQGQALTLNNKGRPGEDPGLGDHLTIEQQQEGSAKTCQRTNIRLEGGRIQVNVSHHSAVVNQSEKRGDLVAVQS